MLRPTQRPRIVGLVLMPAVVSATLFALVPQRAQAAEYACPLKAGQKVAAVKAFKRLALIFQEPRCVNCHGAVNPFSRTSEHGGGHVDIRKETREFLNLAGFESFLISPNANTVGRLKEVAASASDITDNDVVRQKAFEPMLRACRVCHIDSWIIPMRENYFVNRSAKEMCIHIKTSSLTNSPVSFLRHMQDDELVLAGFKGRRGLLEPVTPELPTMRFDTMTRHANDWVEAMGREFHQPADCGCTVDGIILEIQHRIQADPQSGSSKAGMAQFDGTVRFDVLLSPVDGAEDWFRGEVSVTRPMVVRHVVPSAWRCSGSGSQTEDWRLSAVLDRKTGSLNVRFGFVTSDEKATWTCVGPNGMTDTRELYVDLRRRLNAVEMSAKNGTKKDVGSRDAKFLESLTVTVVDSPVGD